MNTRNHILSALSDLKAEIQANYKVREIGVFGSAIRGEQGQMSDIDVLVDFEEDANLFDLVGLALFLEEKLLRKVDIVSKRALRSEIRETVLREVSTI